MFRAACSKGARLIRTPRRATAIHPAVYSTSYRFNSSSTPSPPPSASSSAPPKSSAQAATHRPEAAPTGIPLTSPAAYEQNADLARYLEDLAAHADAPDLMAEDPLTDPAEVYTYPPSKRVPHESQLIIRNDPPLFEHYDDLLQKLGMEKEEMYKDDELDDTALLPYSTRELKSLHHYILFTRRVKQQTSKGKRARFATLIVVGNGDGLVGFGQGKHDDAIVANRKAWIAAVRNMDYVDRFEKRTVWTEMSTKFGSTQVILRPRPVGFGLHCNPYIHQILKAAGIKDCSAKVWGSRTKINVIMATFRMLHAGNAPLAMGDGLGGGGKKMEKGSGMRSAGDVERERGRRLASLRTV